MTITKPAPGWDDGGAALLAPPVLSILLPTIISRAATFAKLHEFLLKQAEGKPVEIIVACDNKEISIGKKRQDLLLQATGEYVVYIDDDDWVAETYVDDILKALEEQPDCVGFLIRCTQNGRNPVMAKASIKYKKWGENEDGYAHTRSPYQKTPVRRSIALLVGFPDLRYAEDKVYSAGLVRHVKTEVFINKVLYHYQFRHEPFAKKYGFTTRLSARRGSGASIRYDYRGRPV